MAPYAHKAKNDARANYKSFRDEKKNGVNDSWRMIEIRNEKRI